jgi:iron complex transport system permease protein
MQNSPKPLHIPNVVFLTLTAAAVIIGVSTGPSATSLSDLWPTLLNLLSGTSLNAGPEMILGDIRLPRVLTAALCGAALAAAGCISQALFRNPLASPSITGTESGGVLAAVIAFYTGAAFASPYSLAAVAISGAALSTLAVFFLMRVNGWQKLETLLLAGFALNTLFGAGTSFTLSLALDDHQKSAAMMHWLLGGFQARGWEHVAVGAVLLSVGGLWAGTLAKKLDILSLGEEQASTLGIDTKNLRTQSILAIGVLVGGAVAIAGAIPFVGLIVPHTTRMLVGPHNKRLLFCSLLNGASLVVIADAVARTLRSPSEIEVGIVTSLIGAPYFLWLLLRKRRYQ